MGRLPDDRVQRRRRHRARQPERRKPLTRYFPEVVEAARARRCPPRCVVDGEIVLPIGERLDFEALLQRDPPGRVAGPAACRGDSVPASSRSTCSRSATIDLRELPFARAPGAARATLAAAERRPVHLTPATDDRALAHRWFAAVRGRRARRRGREAARRAAYSQDKRTMLKIKHERTADCVVAGYRVHKIGQRGRLAAARPLRRRGDAAARRRRRRASRRRGGSSSRRAAAADRRPRRRAPVAEWAEPPRGRRPDPRRRPEPLERGQGPVVRPARAGAGGRGRLRAHGGHPLPAHRAVRPLAPRSRPRSCTYGQLEEPVSYDLGKVFSGLP